MDILSLFASALFGAIGYMATNFFVMPILDCRKLRRDVHQRIIEFGNIWNATQAPEHEKMYFATRAREAANIYRTLSAQIAAFSENIAHGRIYCVANKWLNKYDLDTTSKALLALEADALQPDKNFRDEQVRRIKLALCIRV